MSAAATPPVLRPSGRPLGIYAKSAATADFKRKFAAGAVDVAEARRFALQRVAQSLLKDRGARVDRQGELQETFVYRVALCYRGVNGAAPSINTNEAGDRADYCGLMTCGSVWHCPICASKVTSERRADMNAAIAAARERGLSTYLLTYTFSHDREAKLPELLKDFARALSKFKGSRAFREVKEAAGVVGFIRALEVTHGEMNGWHPHTHELVFAPPGAEVHLRKLRRLWVRHLIKHQLAGMRSEWMDLVYMMGGAGKPRRGDGAQQWAYLMQHALTVQDGQFAADYVAKFGLEPGTEQGGRWGLASELTKGHTKAARRFSGRTPFSLLALALDEGDKRAGMLFRDYALAFNGRRQLYWTPGLRRFFELGNERDDDEIAAERRCKKHCVTLDFSTWGTVLATNTRYELLYAVQTRGRRGAEEFIESLKLRRKTHSSEAPVDFNAAFMPLRRRKAA